MHLQRVSKLLDPFIAALSLIKKKSVKNSGANVDGGLLNYKGEMRLQKWKGLTLNLIILESQFPPC
jgi:hypothetical protein